jgi:iron complex outermembrane receptor protein
MKNFFSLLIIFICFSGVWGQNEFKAIIKDSHTKEPLAGANAVLQGSTQGASADINGLILIKNIPDGNQIILFSYIGYQAKADSFRFPLSQTEMIEIFLRVELEETEELVVSATRSSRAIADIPTRIEPISGEELDEKASMKPGEIRMLLNESTGIQTQQTSATSYNSSIRIQGLDGKYTQLLRDGYPLYAGFSSGLSLLQIVPLDLKQVEVIKGASSTLYGGGAIAGLVNLVPKFPADERELSFLFNLTSASGVDASAFYSQKFKTFGTTLFVSYNSGEAYDPANTGLTAIPEFSRYTINPVLFLYLGDETNFRLGFNKTIEERTGGDMHYIAGNGDSTHSYFEENMTDRLSFLLGFDHRFSKAAKVVLKSSISNYDRSVEIPDFKFSGRQLSSFSEATYQYAGPEMEWISGLNLWTDEFTQDRFDTSRVLDYTHATFGIFIQNTWNTAEKLIIETGLRFDYQNEYGGFVLPRISALVKINPDLTMRFGGGLGYKTPTVFTEDSERIQFRNVLPIDTEHTGAEKSLGTNFDINYRTLLSSHLTFNVNTLLFYTKVDKPLVLTPVSAGLYEFQQPDGFIDTKGIETNIKLTYDPFKLFVGYTLADVNNHYDGKVTTFPLVARHRLNNVLIFELEDNLRIGLEAYYFSPQELNDGTTGREFWIFGLMSEKIWEDFSVFLNFENFTDTRQTRFGPIYSGSISEPVFNDIYAPLDGFLINGGVKIKL